MEYFIAAVIILPAVFLAATRSTWLMDYTIAVIAFNRLIRRLVDYYFNGHFNPYSVISLTPLVVAGLMAALAVFDSGLLIGRARRIVLNILWAVALGFMVGCIHSLTAALYSLGEWAAGIGAMAFAASHPKAAGAADRWIKTAGWCAVGVAAYGIWQFFTIPAWDAMWLVQSNMIGYMGLPEPRMMTCFSTMNERGVCSGFLGTAMVAMILNRRWRNTGGWLSAVLILYAMILTEVRTSLIVVALVAILQPVLSRGFGLVRVLTTSIFLTVVAASGLSNLPGATKYASRFDENALAGKGSSMDGRLDLYRGGIGPALSNPLGLGLGSSGMAANRLPGAQSSIGDAGYLQIIAQFGWIGSFLFFGALVQLWKEMALRWRVADRFSRAWPLDPYLPAGRAMLLGALVYLFVADIFAGFSLIWIFFGRAIHQSNSPEVLAWYLENQQAAVAEKASLCESPSR